MIIRKNFKTYQYFSLYVKSSPQKEAEIGNVFIKDKWFETLINSGFFLNKDQLVKYRFNISGIKIIDFYFNNIDIL
jgi:hypothetical protein